MCQLVGAAGQGFNCTLPELRSIAKGRDLALWPHTMLVYASSMQPNPRAFKALYPYEERGEVTEGSHKASVEQTKMMVQKVFPDKETPAE